MQIDRDNFKWWLIYGPPRTGTSYLSRLVARRARHLVSDWGLGHILNNLDKVNDLNTDRFLNDFAQIVLESARRGGGQYLDLCFKQAIMLPAELTQLSKMFGEPQRRIFCIRAPAGFVASAIKKFPRFTPTDLEERYVKMFRIYDQIGGDILEYGPQLSIDDLSSFLAPMKLPPNTEDFVYRGSERTDLVTPRMQEVYENFKDKHFNGPGAAFALKS
ncbi:hypothetical protein [Nioella sp.]|uniref:hypothetical protein n=1 Tax=Nioella sp. TaxID=1912091 RepID=UPI003A86865D